MLQRDLVLFCFVCSIGCHEDHGQPTTAQPVTQPMTMQGSGGTTGDPSTPEGSGGTTGEGYFCENLVITPGTDCFRVGLSCPTSDYLTRYLCQRNGTWALQVFGAPDAGLGSTAGSAGSGGNRDAGAGDAGNGRSSGVSVPCVWDPQRGCPDDVLCEEACCPVQPAISALCTPCCLPRGCGSFGASSCPLDHCVLLPACGGGLACVDPRLDGQPCSLPGHQAGLTGCCAGTVPRCGVLQSTGVCASSVSIHPKPPTCMACGDGTCENGPVYVEDACSCPEDCAGASSN